MHDFLVSVVAFIILIGVMIVVHEFGHFAVAKLCGVRVERFSIGFPPRLFGIKIGDTDYCVSATPLGGYVKMTGENMPGENATLEGADAEKIEAEKTDPGALTSHPRWQRILIGLAGPTANFALAFVLMFWYYGWINEVPSVQVKTTTVDWVIPGSAAARAGIEPGDEITLFGGAHNPTWDDIFEQSVINPNQTVPVAIERGGKTLGLSMHVPADAKSNDFALTEAGLLAKELPGPVVVSQVEPGTPAAAAGFRAGDGIETIDGHAFHNIGSLLAFLKQDGGKPVSVALLRDGKTLPPVEVHPEQLQGGWKLGFDWIPPAMHDSPLGLVRGVSRSAGFCADNSFLILEVVERLFTHQVSVSQLAGPIGIAQMAGEAAQMKGWQPKFMLSSEISLNLGILNLFPFPILDGGMIALLLIEGVLRRDISLNVKERLYQVAFVVLVVFFVFVIFNDITKLPIFAHGMP
ncbi:MAG: RIP metalloprotease RseP [Terracidiphilus sp.]